MFTFADWYEGRCTYEQLPAAEQAQVDAFLEQHWADMASLCEHSEV